MTGHNNNLIINPDKTTCTLFTPDPAEYNSNLGLNINNKALPMALHPKVLGLTLDPKLTYNAHIQNIATHAQKPLQVITRCTRGDARSFFCTYKMYLYAQNYFLKNVFKYCFKSYIKLHEYANCNSANYDV